jgi:hypothetical protein
MIETDFENALSKFIEKPDVANAAFLLENCRGFIVNKAVAWQDSGLNLKDRMREILAELFLILIEEVNTDLVNSVFSLVSYLDLKLRRLVRPKKNRIAGFSSLDDFKDIGRYNFDAFKIELTGEIVCTVRQVLAEQKVSSTGMLEFLFIHVYPEIAWASRLLAEKNNEDIEKRHATDRHRHRKFNRSLINEFSCLNSGDYKEIRNWSSGERSHLAWRIVDITAAETSCSLISELSQLVDWRENFSKNSPENLDKLGICEKIFSVLQNRIAKQEKTIEFVGEEIAAYGSEPDVISDLIAIADYSGRVAESEEIYTVKDSLADIDSKNLDKDFKQACGEIEVWLKQLLHEKKNGENKWV